jgi:predicted amidohydrolase YtcJ
VLDPRRREAGLSHPGTKCSTEPGKFADFVILDRNPLETAPENLVGLKVVETIKEGRSVYMAKG